MAHASDARTAIVDVSESNHEGFRKTAGTPASSKCAAAIDVNHLLYLQNFPDLHRMQRLAELEVARPRLPAQTLGNLLLRHFDQSAVEIRVATRGIAP